MCHRTFIAGSTSYSASNREVCVCVCEHILCVLKLYNIYSYSVCVSVCVTV